MRRLRSEEAGFTLVELMVACAVGTVVMLALFGLADAAQHASTRIERRTDAAGRGRPAMEQMIQLLRSAVCIKSTSTTLPIVAGTDNSVTFYAQIVSGTTASGVWTSAFNPSKYVLTYSSAGTGSLTLDTIPSTTPYPTFTPGTTVSRVLSTGVRPTASAPVFRFYAYDAAGNLDPYNGTAPLSASAGLSATDLPKVAMVRITFTQKASGTNVAASDSDSSFDEIVRLRLVDPAAPNPQNGAVCRA